MVTWQGACQGRLVQSSATELLTLLFGRLLLVWQASFSRRCACVVKAGLCSKDNNVSAHVPFSQNALRRASLRTCKRSPLRRNREFLFSRMTLFRKTAKTLQELDFPDFPVSEETMPRVSLRTSTRSPLRRTKEFLFSRDSTAISPEKQENQENQVPVVFLRFYETGSSGKTGTPCFGIGRGSFLKCRFKQGAGFGGLPIYS